METKEQMRARVRQEVMLRFPEDQRQSEAFLKALDSSVDAMIDKLYEAVNYLELNKLRGKK